MPADRRAPRLVALAVLLAATAGGAVAQSDEPKKGSAPEKPPAAAPSPSTATSAAPAAGSPFDAFKTLCLDHRMRPTESLTAATALGWMPVPRSMMPSIPTEYGVMGVRWRSTSQAASFLVAGHVDKTMGKQTLAMSFCGLVRSGHDKSFRKAASDWAGVPPISESEDEVTAYIFDEGPARHAAVNPEDAASMLQGFQKGSLAMLVIFSDHDETAVIYLTPALGQMASISPVEAKGEP